MEPTDCRYSHKGKVMGYAEWALYTFGSLSIWFVICKLYYVVTGAPGKLVKRTFSDGRTMTVINHDLAVQLIHKEIFQDHCYFRHGISLDGVKNPLVIDVGGNVGFFSAYVAEHYPVAELHLFEPVPLLVEACRENLTKYGCRVYEDKAFETAAPAPKGTTCHLYKLAAGSETGSVEFTFDARTTAASSMVDNAFDASGKLIDFTRAMYLDGILAGIVPAFPTRQICALLAVPVLKYFVFAMCIPFLIFHTIFIVAGGAPKQKVKATVVPLSAVLKARNIQGRKIDFMKIDVEGAEWMVLEGMTDATWDAVDQIVVEVHDGKEGRVTQVMDLLAAKGFKNIHKEDEDLEVHKVIKLSTVFATRTASRK